MIKIDHISKSFNGLRALSEMTLEINDGELFVLIGPDGAGKTTLFRILVTLLLPDRGEVQLNGRDVVKSYKWVRNRVGYMPGTFSLYPDLTVSENLGFYASIFGTSVKANMDLISDVYSRIEPFRDRPAGKLSGGMKQKLALSCALIHRPEVLVLDEPTTGVDAASRTEFWMLLKKIQQEGITIVVSTAYMDEAARGDRSGFLHHGELLVAGTPQQLRESYPLTLYTCRCDNNYALLKALRDEPETASAMLFGKDIHYAPVHPEFPVEHLFNRLESSGRFGRIITTVKSPSLEDAFIHLSSKADRTGEETTNG